MQGNIKTAMIHLQHKIGSDHGDHFQYWTGQKEFGRRKKPQHTWEICWTIERNMRCNFAFYFFKISVPATSSSFLNWKLMGHCVCSRAGLLNWWYVYYWLHTSWHHIWHLQIVEVHSEIPTWYDSDRRQSLVDRVQCIAFALLKNSSTCSWSSYLFLCPASQPGRLRNSVLEHHVVSVRIIKLEGT